MIKLYEIVILYFKNDQSLDLVVFRNCAACVDTGNEGCISQSLIIGVGGSCKGNPVVLKARGQRPSKPPSRAKIGRRSADDKKNCCQA